MNVESLVEKAQSGDKNALEDVVLAIQDKIYYLALRMLWQQEDASEATQEILIIVITKLSTFQFKSKFSTWVYRVAVNYLLNTQKVIAKDPALSFDDFKLDLEIDLEESLDLKKLPEYNVLLNEVRIMCTMAMLLCLDQKHRMAYILGDIFELDHNEASDCLSLSKDNYRKQLSRARAQVLQFTSTSCGIVSNTAKCSCSKKLKGAISRKRVIPTEIRYANNSKETYLDVKHKIDELHQDLKSVALQTSIPILKSPENFIQIVETLMQDI